MRSGVSLSDSWSLENSVHYGSGDGTEQNPYVALTNMAGFRKSVPGGVLRARLGPYAELDMRDRRDPAYDAAFSAPGRTDRIRAAKIGYIAGLDVELPTGLFVSLGYSRKLGGYDAAATNALIIAAGRRF